MARKATYRKWTYTEKEKGFQDFLRYWLTGQNDGALLKVWLKEPIIIEYRAMTGGKIGTLVGYFETKAGKYIQTWAGGEDEHSLTEEIPYGKEKEIFHSEWNSNAPSNWGLVRDGYKYDFSNIKRMGLYKAFPVEFSPLWTRI